MHWMRSSRLGPQHLSNSYSPAGCIPCFEGCSDANALQLKWISTSWPTLSALPTTALLIEDSGSRAIDQCRPSSTRAGAGRAAWEARFATVSFLRNAPIARQ